MDNHAALFAFLRNDRDARLIALSCFACVCNFRLRQSRERSEGLLISLKYTVLQSRLLTRASLL
jgi:hypothetical protein